MNTYKNWGGAGVVLLTLFLATSSSFAQSGRYIDLVNGADTDACTFSNPCTLSRAYGQQADGDRFFIRVRRAGSTVQVPAPTASLTKEISFNPYVEGGSVDGVEGTLEFTGNFKIAPAAQIQFFKGTKIQFEDLTLTSGTRSKDFISGDGDWSERFVITGTLTIPDGEEARLERLSVSKSFTVKGVASKLRIWKEFAVRSGATLSIDDVDVYFHMRRGATEQGVLTVDGRIEDVTKGTRRPLRIARLNNDNSDQGRGGSVSFLGYEDYIPEDGVTSSDCHSLKGSGTLNAGILVIAIGNLCVENLKQIGTVTVSGSLASDVFTAYKVTADLIFRNDIIVGGDVAQWNDSRISFEKTAMIKGDVILRDGGIPYDATETLGEDNATLGAGNTTTSIRKGGRPASGRKYSCWYADGADRRQFEFKNHIPGVQFAGAVSIAGDLNVYSSTLTETTTSTDDETNNTVCAPRVLFMAPFAKASGATEISVTSSVDGSLVVEDTVSFGGNGRVYLDTDSLKTGTDVRKTVHNLRVGGDLAAGGNTIGMAYPATSSIDGMCTGNDTQLLFGNHLVLTDATESVIIGDATNGLTMDALVTLGDLRVEPGKGSLTVTTLHVGPGAELTSTKDVKVTESLILEGELSGELDESSTIKMLTYGNRNTDLVKKASLASMLEALSVQVGSGELRLEEVHKVKNLGLCSGTLSLVDAESTTDSTLHVTGQITVQNGMLKKDANNPGSISTDREKTASVDDRYVLTYITPGMRTVTDALEWFDPRDVIVNHSKAEIMVPGDRSLPGKLAVSKGRLTIDGDLTVGTSPLHRTANSSDDTKDAFNQVNRYSVEVTAGELHTEDMMVYGKVTVSNQSKLVTGGGDLHVLGRVSSGAYAHNTAQVTVEKDAAIDLGDGTLFLGPEDTKKRNGLRGAARLWVWLTLRGSLTGNIHVLKGSKYTNISSARKLGTVTFDGTETPSAGGPLPNHIGTIRLLIPSDTNPLLEVDSLSASQGVVITNGKKVMIKGDVLLDSASIFPFTIDSLIFGGDLTLQGTGGINTELNSNSAKRNVVIRGSFVQTKASPGPNAGVKLHPMTTKTVMGDMMVAADASRYEGETVSGNIPMLVVHGDFHFAKNGKLNAKIEFTGKEAQEVMTGDTTALHSVVVHNPNGLLLKSHVMQQKMAMLTLRQGKIHSMPVDSMFTWTVQNVQVEQELRDRMSAQEGNKCGADNDEACKASILRGSRQSYAVMPVVRHILQGTAGTGAASGGYLFPVGMDHKTDQDTLSHYRPLILQLPSDLNDTTAVTVSPIMIPKGEMPAWPAENITVPHAGGSLTLDVHAPIFWKIDLGEELPTNTNLRVVADGIQNVTDITGLRIVQWDCMWKNPKLAGRVPAQAEASSFAVNGYINGVVNLTQEGIGLESCAIVGIAANGKENPIDQADLSAGRAMVQFIHNVPAPGSAPMEIDLGEVQISSNLRFRHATAYRPVGAGETQNVTIQPVGAPAAQAITDTVSLMPDRNYAVIVHGSLADPKLKALDMRMASSVSSKAEVRLVHGSADLGPAQVQVMDPTDPMIPVTTLAGNLMLDDVTRRYFSLDPSAQVVQVRSTDGDVEEFYELDLYGYGGQTLVMNLSGTKRDLTILGVDKDGEIVPVQVVTGTENEMAEIPKEFALHGNYPNPFNPSTKIQFDLPERADVSVQIVDLLGREVMVIPVQEMEAGANRGIALNAASLASGTYLYRLIAVGAEQRHLKTGRMTLVK